MKKIYFGMAYSAREYFNELNSTDANSPVDVYAHKYSRDDLFRFAEAYAYHLGIESSRCTCGAPSPIEVVGEHGNVCYCLRCKKEIL